MGFGGNLEVPSRQIVETRAVVVDSFERAILGHHRKERSPCSPPDIHPLSAYWPMALASSGVEMPLASTLLERTRG